MGTTLKRISLIAILTLSLLLIICFFASCFKLMPPITEPDQKMVAASNEYFQQSLPICAGDTYRYKKLLESGDYETIENSLGKLVEGYMVDYRLENALIEGFDYFHPDNGFEIEMFDRWVDATGSGIAYTARGMYLASCGFAARGTKFADETPKENFDKLYDYLEKAYPDLKTATEKNRDILPAYIWLMNISRNSWSENNKTDVFKEARKYHKRSFYLRFHYMISLEPKWGGSYYLMQAFAQMAARKTDLNPGLYTMLGEPISAEADAYYYKGDYIKAAELYTKALEYGDRTDWLQYRAACYHKLDKLELAVQDLEKILDYDPGHKVARKACFEFKVYLARLENRNNSAKEAGK